MAARKQNLRQWARSLKQEAHAVYLAARHPRTPWYAKALALCVAGYAFSPIDLKPDFIPVLGYLDDVVIVPLGILAVIKLIPKEVMQESRKAAARAAGAPSQQTCDGHYYLDLDKLAYAFSVDRFSIFRIKLEGFSKKNAISWPAWFKARGLLMKCLIVVSVSGTRCSTHPL